MADWSDLPGDILVDVLKRLSVVSHRLRCGAVCTSWERVELHGRSFLRAPLQVSGLMVPTGPNSETREFYSLSEKKIYRNLLLPVPHSLKCLELISPAGWLLTIGKKKYDAALFNPFSGIRIHLPPVSKLMDPRRPHEVVRLKHYPCVWGAASSGHPEDKSKLIVILNFRTPDKLAFARPGDESWTLIVRQVGTWGWYEKLDISDVIFFKEHFYAVDYYGRLFRCDDIGGPDPKLVLVASLKFLCPEENPPCTYEWYYLVESLGDLFVVVRTTTFSNAMGEMIRKRQSQQEESTTRNQEVIYDDCSCEGVQDPKNSGDWDIIYGFPQRMVDCSSYRVEVPMKYKTMSFQVFKGDMDARKWVKVNKLDDRAFVLGWHTSSAVSATDIDGYEQNCVYFVDHYYESQKFRGHDNGTFCMEDGSVRPIYPYTAGSEKKPVPLWLTLIPS